ncbi:receptor-activated Ca2+-permeable cation channel [Mycena sanguinolenta]|nr:receptor-activated Ca2+-permeable cation channel [Mycena sanguinolenta]
MEQGVAERQPLINPGDIEATPVYPVIHMIRQDVIHFIDTPLTYAALMAPDLTYTLIHPLLEKYCNLQRAHSNLSIVFCLLLNRVHFIRDENISTASVSQSRATLCEILAIRTLRDYGSSMMDLTTILTTSWPVYSGAEPEVLAHGRREFADFDEEERVGNAIEMAIVGKAKNFIKSTSCQKVIDGIWSGRYVYQAESNHSILSDTYKRTPIHFYDPHKAPLLDHYRLKVPAIRSVLEYFNFLILFVLFVIAMEFNELERINFSEALFMIYALGFTLEKVAAMQEHGIKVYFKGTWNGFDMVFVATYCCYAFFRVYGVYHEHIWARSMGLDCMAIIACLMFPRLAFVTLKNNLMVLSLRAMMMQFLVLMMIAAFCFCGFLYALWTLSRNSAGYSLSQIAWWMLDLWFGLDASGFDRAGQFHPSFGPILMVTYACLSNTLLLTVLVSILSNTFATINEDAAAEAMFRKAVSTIEGVKADSLFSYQPPINLVALCIMLPASYLLSPRWFHKVNVFMIRITSFPILLLISLYERQAKKNGTTNIYDTLTVVTERMLETLPRRFKLLNFLEGLAGSDSDIDIVFEIEAELMESAQESALAMDDAPTNGEPFNHYKRRLSPYSSVTRPQQQQAPAPAPAAAQPTPTPTPSPPHHAHPPGPRTRVTSLMHRGAEAAHTFTSPLAQIFQPLVVDDGGIPQDNVPHGQHHPPASPTVPAHPPTGVSYGPAYRRRLSSMHVRDQSGHAFHGPGHTRQSSGMLFPAGGGGDDPFYASPDQRTESLPTAEEVEENKDGGEWMRRLDSMEARQERIEALLEGIAQAVRK